VKEKASIIFISHRLEEVLQLSDRIVVFKDGKFSAEFKGSEATVEEIEEKMVGHEMTEEHYRENEQIEPQEEVMLEVEELTMKGYFEPISFSLHTGEILSFVGAIGSGKEEVCRCVAGIQRPDSGRFVMDGRLIRNGSAKSAIKEGIGYIPIDRRQEGLALQLDVAANINFLILKDMIRGGLISPGKEKASAGKWVKNCQIKTPGIKIHCSKLSGGNQQKVVIAKWLAANIKILILDHPTRGIDVGTKDEIYHRIRQLAAQGMAVILMSDRIEEDIGLCNRMIIMKDGKISREMECPRGNKPTPLKIIEYIV
jgi:ribose transport system ATP-binding protein